MAEITAYKNSAHADSATKKQLRFSKNTTRKELKDAWAYFEKREREQAALVDGGCHIPITTTSSHQLRGARTAH